MASEVTFRQLFCRAVNCGVMFFICRPCYRRQAYCSDPCRRQTRLGQQREANRRYQADPDVRRDHRNHQREYRKLLRESRATDPSSIMECGWDSIPEPLVKNEPESPPPPEEPHDPHDPQSSPPPKELHDPPKPTWRERFSHIVCIICGRVGKFLDAFVPRE